MNKLFKKIITYPVFLVNVTRWKLGFCRRLRIYDPVFIYQMGKVSSRSIFDPLLKTYKGAVIHGHGFGPEYSAGEVQELYWYWHSDSPPNRLNVISITRDPIAQNVSAFFMNFERHTGVKVTDSKFSMREIRDLFLKSWPKHGSLEWFDRNILDKFGIDVYASPFPDCGYSHYENGNVRLLVFRCELDDEVKNQCVRAFLDMPDFKLVRTNLGEEKVYGNLYSTFRNEVRLPEEYINQMCNSKYFRHFYSDAFIAGTRKRWSENSFEIPGKGISVNKSA